MAGSAIPAGLLYSGYGPPRPTQLSWGSWLRRVSPSPWALEALMGNEFSGIMLECSETDMVPSGTGYDDTRYQTCSIPGSQIGHDSVPGQVHLREHFGFTQSHLWRNFGIILVLWFLYILIRSVCLTFVTRDKSGSSGRVFKKSKRHDVESQPESSGSSTIDVEPTTQSQIPDEKLATSTTFTFEDVNCFVPVGGKERQLLRGVDGYARPGQLTALVGASGAVKTTLLDTLSQRRNTGRVTGKFKLNGQSLDKSFARSCGFVMQQDVHEPNATVREALEFSARMRQPWHVSEEEKMAYVEHVIHLLEMEQIAEALIGDGQLSVEERERVTTGVELAARPTSLLFLDEPTSGLDSQAAFALVEFLRRIAAEGIPVACTIYQPSGVLFDMFDHVLLLAPGGRTVYFGETGDNASKVVEYFDRYGAVIGDDVNPAEFILSTVTAKDERSLDNPKFGINQGRLRHVESGTGNTLTIANQPGQFALPLWAQVMAVTKRHWISVWRDGLFQSRKQPPRYPK
ncbi:hypothetical protein ACHAP5_011875 [Fusarium lateritium]